MKKDFVANASITINAPITKVWDALVNPKVIKIYMFGTETISDWEVGSKIVWKGEWKEKPYQDNGIILKIEPEKILQYTHYSPITRLPDIPENYHTVTYSVTQKEDSTHLSISQDNNADEKAQNESEKMWGMMLMDLKKLMEG